MTPHQREQLLREWRILPEDKRGKQAKPIADILERHLKELGLQERLVEDQLSEAWIEVVGEATAQYSKPVHLKRGDLIVAVSQPALLYDLERFHKSEILKRFQERFGAGVIRDLRFRVGY
ncbi:MAG: DUF721 domain-containing protein [Verrucomicrobiota bacterium]